MKKIVLLLSLFSLFSCEKSLSQEIKKQMKQNEDYWKTRNELISKEKKIMEYPIQKGTTITEKRTNRIYINSTGWQFEIFVNDVLLFNLKGEQTIGQGGITGDYDINQLLLTSGTHEVKVRIYPTYGEKIFGVGGAIGLTFSYFKDRDLRTVIYNEKMGGSFGLVLDQANEQWVADKGIFGEPGFVEAHYEPKEPLLLKGLPAYEWRSTFDAEVPFNLTGWRNSVNLKKEQEDKKKNIKTEVIEEYKKIYQIIKNRDVTAYLSLVKEREELVTTALYYEENEKELRKNEFVKLIQNTDYELEPLFEETFQLEYQGYGKLVTLLHLADGEGIIRFKNKKDPNDTVYMDFMLQRKKKGDKLTVI